MMKQGLTRRGLFGLGGAGISLGLISWPLSARPLKSSDEILVNQTGFLARGPKQIAVRSEGAVTDGLISFDLVECETDRVVKGMTAKVSVTSDRHIGFANLSGINIQGTFCLRSGDVKSLPIKISDAPFDEVQRALTRAFYLQRCGVPLDDPETGLVHSACHHQDARSRATRQPRNCTGGWHDAGDFGKYVASTSVVIGELLSLYEETPERFRDGALGIPEGGDGEPDLLSEMRVGLDWLVKMQRPSGAVERKVSGNEWPSMTDPPEADTQQRFAYGASTADTAKAAAALAIAARVFGADEGNQYLEAAERAWGFLERHPQVEVDQMPGDDNGSGSYLPKIQSKTQQEMSWDKTDRFWAALELYLTTGKKDYRKPIKAHASSMYIWPATWSNPALIGLLNHLRMEARDDIAHLRPEIKKRLIERAREYEKTSRLSPWGTATLEFYWGSNREVAARGRILAAAYQQSGDGKFLSAAISQADYLLGKNPQGLSYVTGTGTRSVQNPHHRLNLVARAGGAKHVIPGLLVGGPNSDASEEELSSQTGIDRYRDHAASFETNEFAIDYNAALLSLLARLSVADARHGDGFMAMIRRLLGR